MAYFFYYRTDAATIQAIQSGAASPLYREMIGEDGTRYYVEPGEMAYRMVGGSREERDEDGRLWTVYFDVDPQAFAAAVMAGQVRAASNEVVLCGAVRVATAEEEEYGYVPRYTPEAVPA
jgi:hypothetical protein